MLKMTGVLWKSLSNLLPNNIILGEATDCSSEDAFQADLKLKLLLGEIEVARAKNVLLIPPGIKNSTNTNGLFGLLVVTNFRISFITVDDQELPINQVIAYQENTFLGRNDVTLSNIDIIYQITDKKKKLVGPHLKTSSRIEAIQIICKNFRLLKFDFKKSEIGKGTLIANALAKFAFPNQHSLLFLYKYSEKYYSSYRNVTMFNKSSDWSQEINRCGATGWRIVNRERPNNIPCGSLPFNFVIPQNYLDVDYLKDSEGFRDSRGAIWVWGLGEASLIRMADLIPTITDRTKENVMLEKIRICHPNKKQIYLMDLTKNLPSVQDVNYSYVKLRELCTPENTKQFIGQDARFYTYLDKSSWLLYVSLCLKHAIDAAEQMKGETSVVLQENDGRDMCCVISSLIQLILDSSSRTINGFQTLIQKEWIALGHPFSDRMGHVVNNFTSEQSPLFLLFLDCTWQLLQQFPEDFEFSETFLTTIWDSVFLPIFDTFQFNSEHDRMTAVQNEKLILRSVWDWGEEFSDRDIALFSNPLFKKPPENSRKSLVILPPNAVALPIIGAGISPGNFRPSMIINQQFNLPPPPVQDRFLEPRYQIRDLDIWTQCYFRWLPFLEIQNGGLIQIDLFNRILINKISKLQQALQTGEYDEPSSPTIKSNGENLADKLMPSVNSFFPFSRNFSESNELIEILTTSSELLTEGSIFDALSIAQAPD